MLEKFAEQRVSFNVENKRESAFRTFMEEMYIAEKYVFECGCFSEDQVKEELDEI